MGSTDKEQPAGSPYTLPYTGYIEGHGRYILQSLDQMLLTVQSKREVPFVLSDAFLAHTIQLRGWHPSSFDTQGQLDSLPFSHREFYDYSASPEWLGSWERKNVVAERLRDWLTFGSVFIEEDTRIARPADFLQKLTPILSSNEERERAQDLTWRFSPGFLEAHDLCVVHFTEPADEPA